jgi:hypothetical protein
MGTKVTLPTETVENQFFVKRNTSGAVTSTGSAQPRLIDSKGYLWTKGENVPNYHVRVRNGELIPHTNFEQFAASGVSYAGARAWTYTNGTGSAAYEPAWWMPITLITDQEMKSYLTNDHAVYVQKAAASIIDRGHDTLTFLAEFASTKRMFMQLGENLKRFLELAKRSFKTSSKSYKGKSVERRLLDHISGEWLTARYGWRTLYYDIVQLHQVLTNLQDFNRTRFSERSGTTSEFSEVVSVSTAGTSPKVRDTVTDTVKVSVRGSVTADVEVDAFRFDALSTAYEVIPFSFVFDWFINVGRSIAALKLRNRASAYVASYGYLVEVSRTWERELVSHGSDKTNVQVSGRYVTEGVYTLRVPTSVSITPQFSVNLSDLKVLDLVTLLVKRV